VFLKFSKVPIGEEVSIHQQKTCPKIKILEIDINNLGKILPSLIGLEGVLF
jgi:hypothetical protein